jgi:hypothetical protein
MTHAVIVIYLFAATGRYNSERTTDRYVNKDLKLNIKGCKLILTFIVNLISLEKQRSLFLFYFLILT